MELWNIGSEIVRKYKMLLIISILMLILTLIIFINLGMEVSSKYLVGNILVIPFAYLSLRIYEKYTKLNNVVYLKKQWGHARDKKRDFKNISELFKYFKDVSNKKYIDNQTWFDLNMDNIFGEVDRTLTTVGQSVLYKLLRYPLFDKQELSKRMKLIKRVSEDKDLRLEIQLNLLKLGKDSSKNITNFLWDELPKPSRLRYLFIFMSFVAAISVGSIKFLGIKSIFLIIPVYIINLLIHMYMNKKYLHKIPTLVYLGELINCALRIKDLDVKGIEEYQQKLEKDTKNVKNIAKKTVLLLPPKSMEIFEMIHEYLKIFFLLGVNSFNSSIDDINKNIEELKEMYLILGELDSLQSIASYRESLESFVEPEFSKDAFVELKDVKHPLLANPVSNSINIQQKGILITGSNMAGKSTFLRTVGINVVFSQTICTCLASSYKSRLFNIITSISQMDDITEGKSFYFTESERLLEITKESDTEYTTLCIVDELLAGTNSLERINASEEILKYMIKNNALVVVATHDLDLAKRLNNNYKCYYFNDNVSEKGLDFDYKIKEGIAVTSNAIRLLDYLGYPKEIVNRAKERINSSIDRFNS